MGLTFTSWTEYKDDAGESQTLSWSPATGFFDAAQGGGFLIRPHCEAIRQALVERYWACRLNETVPLSESDPMHQRWDLLLAPFDVGYLTLYTRLKAIYDGVGDLVPFFVDHDDHGGDWHHQEDLAPLYDKTTLLAHLGITEWDEPLKNTIYLPTLIYRSYLILDHLRWTSQLASLQELRGKHYEARADFHIVDTVDEAVKELGKMSLGGFGHCGAESFVFKLGEGPDYFQGTATCGQGRWTRHPISDHCKHTWDFYNFIQAAGEQGAPARIWDAGTSGYIQNRWHRLDSDNNPDNDDSETTDWTPAESALTIPVYPAAPALNCGSWRGWSMTPPYENDRHATFILKWDCADGFVFLTTPP